MQSVPALETKDNTQSVSVPHVKVRKHLRLLGRFRKPLPTPSSIFPEKKWGGGGGDGYLGSVHLFR